RRRLAVGPRDADNVKPVRRPPEEHVGGRSHRRTRVRDDDLRHPNIERPLDDERDGTLRHRLAGEVVAVRTSARHAEEERPRADAVGRVRELLHVDGSATDHVDRPHCGDEALQIQHRPASLTTVAGHHAQVGAPTAAAHGLHASTGQDAQRRSHEREPARTKDVVVQAREPGTVDVDAPAAVDRAHQWTFSSGGTSRYCRSNEAICANAGAATTPPKIAFLGSSTDTRTTSLGSLAGTMPTNVATYLPGSYPCGPGTCAVPVLPATE